MKIRVPYRVRWWVRCRASELAFRLALARLQRVPPGQLPSRRTIERLRFGWNNDSFVADADYLQAVAQAAAAARGNILECGSGLTTVLQAALAKNATVWVLEHSLEWLQKLHRLLALYGLEHRVRLCHARLIEYGDFHWYELPPELPNSFSLVICDGPPAATTPGGRYGLLPVLRERLGGSIVLMDDTDRQDEQVILEQWKKEYAVRLRDTGAFSVFEVPAAHPSIVD